MYYCLSTLPPFSTIRTKPRVPIRAMRAVVQRVASASVEVSAYTLTNISLSNFITSSSNCLFAFRWKAARYRRLGRACSSWSAFTSPIPPPTPNTCISSHFFCCCRRRFQFSFFQYQNFDWMFRCRKVLNMRLFTNETTGRGWDQNVISPSFPFLTETFNCIDGCFQLSFICVSSQVMQMNYQVLLGNYFS